MKYDLNMRVDKVSEYANEILKSTSKNSEVFELIKKLRSLINSFDESWMSNAALKSKNAFLENADQFSKFEASLNTLGKVSFDISSMRKATEKEIINIVNDL